MTLSTIPRTLGDTNLHDLRCSNATCGELLKSSSPVEVYRTLGARWICAQCVKCKQWTAKQWEAA